MLEILLQTKAVLPLATPKEIVVAFGVSKCYRQNMITRSFWAKKIHELWKEKNIIWIAGVRRAGKTTICESMNLPIYDCELGSVRRILDDPENFFKEQKAFAIVLDEIHKLPDPSNVLKIAADHFKNLRIIATGSSSLQAKDKFKDALTDRKRILWMTPMNSTDTNEFQVGLLDRMIRGGLPPAILSEKFNDHFYQDWVESFWAKDVQELFKIEKRYSFIKFFELLALQSGDLFEATRFAGECEVSRPTIQKYLDVLEMSLVVYRLRPFHKNRGHEVISAPKVYFFDTGFISFFKGINQLSDEVRGHYWEHLVLNELFNYFPKDAIYYWRDKNKMEVDFVIQQRGKQPITVECKTKAKNFTTSRIESFRRLHAGEENWCLASDIKEQYQRTFGNIKVRFLNLQHLAQRI